MPMKTFQDKAYQRLQQHRYQLTEGLTKGETADFLDHLTRIMDEYFRESFESSRIGPRMNILKNPYVIIAQGGYGRSELCLHSDIDLLFLFKTGVPSEAEELIREVVYPLWDMGLEVGHATRSVKECLSLAAKDFEVLTSLLDARFICGISPLYSELMHKLHEGILRKKATKIIRWLVETNRERHQRFGDSAYLLEPNLKEGQGGLRDYHTMLWIARIKSNLKQARDLEYFGYLSHGEYYDLRDALRFIWTVRNRLHLLVGRRNDRLHFEHQTQLARIFKFKTHNGQQPVERFLGKLHGKMEFLKLQHDMFLYEQGHDRTSGRRRKTVKTTDIDGLTVHRGMLNFTSPEGILDSPVLLIHIFEESARLKIPLSSEAKRLAKEFLYLINDDLRKSPAVVKSFERILVTPAPTFNVLNEMLNTGFLARFIPEMSEITDRIQYDEYHLYPVDKHTLRTVQTLKQFATPEAAQQDPLCHTLYRETPKRKLLMWAALLHDIGKGVPGKGHSRTGAEIARQILKRTGYRQADIDVVAFLVEEHLLLMKTATRRDVNDEETAIVCARRIKSTDRLKQLYMLTVADSIATGPKAWNQWSEALLRELFLKVMNILKHGELASGEAVAIVEQKKAEILDKTADPSEAKKIEALFSVMSPRYLLYTPAEAIREHARLYERVDNAEFTWNIEKNPESNTRTVTICAKDRPGLFSKIAGVFTLTGVDILASQVYTWRNNMALDIFTVTPPPDQIFESERWERARKHLEEALDDRLDLNQALKTRIAAHRNYKPKTLEKPNKIVVDNTSSSFFTIIEVFTYDFPGLLFCITDALFKCGLDVWVAKIATNVDHVIDVFYVRDYDGQKVDSPEQVAAIQSAVQKALPGIDLQSEDEPENSTL